MTVHRRLPDATPRCQGHVAGKRLCLLLTVCSIIATACSTGQPPQPAPGVALGAPVTSPGQATSTVESPIGEAELHAGVRYRFADVVPGKLAVELTGPQPQVVNSFAPTVVVLSDAHDTAVDLVTFADTSSLRVISEPFVAPDEIATDADAERVSKPAPPHLLAYFAQLSFMSVTAPERDLSVGGRPARAVDVRVRDLPTQAHACGRGAPMSCVGYFFLPVGRYYSAQAGDELRLMTVDTPGGLVFVVQRLNRPEAQAVLDSVAFVPTS